MASKKKTGIIIVGVALAALLLAGGVAAAKSLPPPENPDLDPEPLPEPEPQEEIQIKPPPLDDGDNWGVTPDGLRPVFLAAEEASGLPGLSRFLAIWAWGAFRAMQEPVDLGAALVLALENPFLAREFHNEDPDEVSMSQKGYDNVLKKYPNITKPKFGEQWRNYGSAGLFDLLAGTQVWNLTYGGYTPPAYNLLPAQVLHDIPKSTYLATIIVRRIFKGDYKVLTDNPTDTWTNVRRVTANPSAFLQDSSYSKQVGERFQMRAQEIGIDLSKVANTTLGDLKNWGGVTGMSGEGKGAKKVYQAVVG